MESGLVQSQMLNEAVERVMSMVLVASRRVQRGPIEPHFSETPDQSQGKSPVFALPQAQLERIRIEIREGGEMDGFKSLQSDESYSLWINGTTALLQANSMWVGILGSEHSNEKGN